MDISTLQSLYRDSKLHPVALVEEIYDRIEADGLHPVWISLVPKTENLARAQELASAGSVDTLPLFGMPFAVKDNIDVAGLPTTAGCPAYAYQPVTTATAVQRLLDAGAILIGKTNLDQFATGLVGTRSPHGACSSVFNPLYISGGSSSGSAVAVAKGLVSFSLGTDTAGSGRVPAAFNQIVGLKPTRGALSTTGVVPACRTLDCVSIFAETCADAAKVFSTAQAFDAVDSYSRDSKTMSPRAWDITSFRFGVPRPEQLEFFGDSDSAISFAKSIQSLETLGGTKVEIDFAPFRAAANLLYSGAWVAERLAAIGSFLSDHASEIDPTVYKIIAGAERFTAVDAFQATYKLEELRRVTAKVWDVIDLLLLPTVPRTYTIAEVQAAPIETNTNLGYYTNFVNLLDLAAVAAPAGLKSSGLPFGVSLIAPAFSEASLLLTADSLHRKLTATISASARKLSETPALEAQKRPPETMPIAVVGAHLTGQPLNWQLTERHGKLLATTKTSREYRLYALPNSTPAKPGLLYEPGFEGPGIEVEVWALPIETVGSFLAMIPPPLAIGSLRLESGEIVKGFLCEPAGLAGAKEITHLRGWRNYISQL
ncbi:allophanate hydrolase [Silvibacterium bohemicum]|uniref:Allophanate hydrolase n=1 Tax=Silvibacterium bohemicum TaxID=1577686 RepID=A0A841JSG0_9BACT|nr:allophanate hydrolase [Silvibacterium bohemicum]MBB6143385.1 allophanate hydrolase [Silvibacterium bohemicum]